MPFSDSEYALNHVYTIATVCLGILMNAIDNRTDIYSNNVMKQIKQITMVKMANTVPDNTVIAIYQY